MIYKKFIKRLIDLLASITLFLVLFPVFVLVTILLFIVNNGKPFFLQPRPGKNEKIFNIIKFKTMNDKKDENGVLLADQHRVTRIGLFVRKTSLDEIPQLLNVIKGDMSFIGPRPLRVHYLPYYTDKEQLRHTVLPGITGLAQVSGRNTLDWEKRLALDIVYAEKLSFLMDLRIVFQTIGKVIKSDGFEVDQANLMEDLDVYRSKN